VSAELIGILAVGVALVGVQVTVSLWIVSWLRVLDGRVSHVDQRMARLEGLIEYIRPSLACASGTPRSASSESICSANA